MSQHECECIEHDQDHEPSNFQFEISSGNNETHTSSSLGVRDPDVIEYSQFELINTSELPLRSKKIYTVLDNATFSDENVKDFSSGSDDVFIPESSPHSSTSQTSSETGDRVYQQDLQIVYPSTSRIQENTITFQENADNSNQHDLDIARPSTSGNHENGDFQECDIPRKRKIFPVKGNKSKKRSKNERTWKKKAAAIAREKGEEYISYKNKVIPKKSVQEGILCHEKCRLQCSTNFAIDERQSILQSYYSLDVNSKNALLFNSIVSKPVARQRCNAKTHKSASYKYYVKFAGVTKQVCKLGLCRLYQISRKKIDLIIKSIKSGISAPNPDCRGKHQNRPHKMDEDVVNCVKAHISSFPAEQSHYSRSKNMHKLYLSPLLNVTKMHSLYLEMCKKENLTEKYKIKKTTYNKIFVTEFNLSFGYPKSDTCATCDAGDSNEVHKENYYAAVEAMQADRKKPKPADGVLYITVDLQQTMPLPKLTTSKAFYLRQLWFYNFGIHVIDGTSKEKAVCCTWTEDIADRGSSEVASALLRFVEVDSSCQGKDHLIIWSDSCAGQNKNFNLICLYQYLILRGYFKIIDHKFPEVGHSYLDSDRDFGRIEKVLRKNDTIYAPEQYRTIISKASRNNIVIDMTDHFRKINDLQLNLNLINRKKNTNNGKISFRDGVKWIRVDEYGSFLYKESYDEMTPFQKVDILKKRGQINPNFEVPRVNGKYGTVSLEKKANIKDQLKFVKPEYRYYYQSILGEE